MDQTTKEVIQKAKLLQETIDRLNEELDKLLKPLVVAAIKEGDTADVDTLIKEMPQGCARSELQTWLNQHTKS